MKYKARKVFMDIVRLLEGEEPETIDEVIESFEEELKYLKNFESKKNVGRLFNMRKQAIGKHDKEKHKVFVEAWERVG